MRTRAVLALSLSLVLLAALQVRAGGPKTRLVSKTSSGDPANGHSGHPDVSSSGRFVAFDSGAPNLPGIATTDVYVRDLETGKTRLVSKTSGGDPASGGTSSNPDISESGRFVAFESSATNLPGDDGWTSIYVHDRQTGNTRLVSKNSAGDPATGGQSFSASISASGRYVAFESSATNLPTEATTSVYIHDRQTGDTELVSLTSGGLPSTGGGSFDPAVSDSGRYVAFESSATNLPGDDAWSDVYVHDRQTGKTRLASKTSGGTPANGDSESASISASGRYVAFESFASNLPGDDSVIDVFVHDRQTGNTQLLSKSSGEDPADDTSARPDISDSGRYVAFESHADNLPGNDAVENVFVRDRQAGSTRLVTKTSDGAPADGSSESASISESGRYVAFESHATNLPGDDTFQDAFIHGPLI